MAKKDNDAIYDAFLADLKKINPKVEEILDDATNAKLKESVLNRSEMSRQMDALAAERAEVAAFVEQEKTKVQGWQDWYGGVTQDISNMQTELKSYKDAYGQLDSTTKRQVAESHGMTKEDFEKNLQQRDVAAIKFVDDLTDLKIDHRDRFKEKLDTGAVYKIAGEKNLPLDVAYNLYIGDRVQKLNEKQVEERIAQAKIDAVAEYATKHNLPVISSNPDYIHPIDAKQPLTNPNERINAAVADFTKRQAQR
jgi:hypothetical protein